MEPIRTHDALFRFVFGAPAAMAELLQASLPRDVAAGFDWGRLTVADGTFVDAELRAQQSDLLFTARAVDGKCALVYVVCEHKSRPERFTCWQLTRYVVRVLERWHRANPDSSHLPVVVPFVLHHGDRPWLAPRSPDELVDVVAFAPAARAWVRDRQLRLPFFLLDLAAMDESQIDALELSAATALTLRFLQFLRAAPLPVATAAIERWSSLVHALNRHASGRDVLVALCTWWLCNGPAEPETLRTVMTQIRENTPEGAPVRTLLDLVLEEGERRALERGVQQGMERGMQQGRHDGLLAGQRELLLEQLRARFGELPARWEMRLQRAEAGELRTWARRVLTASSLDEVFSS